MVVHYTRIGLSMGLLLVAVRAGAAAVSTVEDLTGCKLQNGRAVLPAAGSSGASNGPMYKFATNLFSAVPSTADGQVPSAEETITRIRESKTADVQYLPQKGGSLWAFSGAVTEVPGALYLSDLSGKKLDEPFSIPKTSQNLAGQCSLHEGGIYLLKTTDGRFVLLRLLDETDTVAVIQYVYQADGSTTFNIPINPAIPYQRPVEAQTPPAPVAAAPTGPSIILPSTQPYAAPRLTAVLPPAARPELGPGDVNEGGVIRLISGSHASPGLEPTIDTFAHQRMEMLQHRLDIIAEAARTPAEIDRKSQAIADLAFLHPDEPQVADLLVTEISFFNPRSNNRDVTPDALHPCFTALKLMGKAATNACLKGMRSLDLDAPGEGIDSAMYKAKLLGMVVRSVEGNEVAEFILKREADKETDPKHRAVFEFLLEK